MGNFDLRDPNIQIALMVTLVAVTIGHFFFIAKALPFGFQTRAEEIANLEEQYETLSSDLMKAKQTASRLPQVRAEYEAISEQWEEAKSLLPTSQEMAEVLSQVTVAGQRSGVDFLLFEPRPPAPREIYMENPIAVTVSGGYHEIGMFLSRVSNLPRIINVNSVDLKNVTNPIDAELPDLVEATMDLAAYTLIPGGGAATTPAPAELNQTPRASGGKRGSH
jgi:type IV pilus assembly protein PilO